MRHYYKALPYAEQAYSLAPNESLTNLALGAILTYLDRAKEALPYIEKSIKLDPNFFEVKAYYKGISYFTIGNYQQSIEVLKYALTINSNFVGTRLVLATSYGLLNQEEETVKALKDYQKMLPTPDTGTSLYYFHPWKDHKIFDQFFEGIIKAGFKGDPKYYKINKLNRLNGQEIKKLFMGSKLFLDNGFVWQISKNGAVEFPTVSGPNNPVLKGKA